MPLVLLSLLLLGAPMPIEPVPAQPQRPSPVTSVALATAARSFSEPFTVAVHLTVAPEWYLYWTNPGDAGLPLAVRWKLPAGFSAGELRFPTPRKIVHEGIVAYGYYTELIALCTLTPPPGYHPSVNDTIGADLSWLVCSESCIPGKASVSLPPGNRLSATHDARELFERFARMAPGSLADAGISVGTATATHAGGELVVHIPIAGTIDDFYPETIENCVIDHKRVVVDRGGVTIPVTPFDSSTAVASVSGLAIVNGKGYRIDASLGQ